jgi:hypothetical protein
MPYDPAVLEPRSYVADELHDANPKKECIENYSGKEWPHNIRNLQIHNNQRLVWLKDSPA